MSQTPPIFKANQWGHDSGQPTSVQHRFELTLVQQLFFVDGMVLVASAQ